MYWLTAKTFKKAVKEAEQEISSDSKFAACGEVSTALSDTSPSNLPPKVHFLGTYSANAEDPKSLEGGSVLLSKGNLQVRKLPTIPGTCSTSGTGYRALYRPITGQGEDADGKFTISVGKMNSTTGQLFWIQEYSDSTSSSFVALPGQSQHKVLVTGTIEIVVADSSSNEASSTVVARMKEAVFMSNKHSKTRTFQKFELTLEGEDATHGTTSENSS